MRASDHLVQPDQPIRADHHNELARSVAAALQVKAGPGITAKQTDSGLILSIQQRPDWFVPARITSKSGSDPDLPANITYGVKGIFEASATMSGAVPAYGRPVKGADAAFTKIRPAAVGSFCYILRDRNAAGTITAKLVLLPGGSEGETLFYEECGATASAAVNEDAPVSGGIIRQLRRAFGI